MRIKLIKKYAVHSRELPADTEMKVTNELGNDLICKGVAIELNYVTKEEIGVVDLLIGDLEENKQIKKHAKKATKKQNLNNESEGYKQLDKPD